MSSGSVVGLTQRPGLATGRHATPSNPEKTLRRSLRRAACRAAQHVFCARPGASRVDLANRRHPAELMAGQEQFVILQATTCRPRTHIGQPIRPPAVHARAKTSAGTGLGDQAQTKVCSAAGPAPPRTASACRTRKRSLGAARSYFFTDSSLPVAS